jgi:hypothetical protein
MAQTYTSEDIKAMTGHSAEYWIANTAWDGSAGDTERRRLDIDIHKLLHRIRRTKNAEKRRVLELARAELEKERAAVCAQYPYPRILNVEDSPDDPENWDDNNYEVNRQ